MNQERIPASGLRPRQRIFYGWWLTGVAAFVMVIGTVPIFQGMTAWFVVLEREFGGNRAQLSLAFSLTRAEGTVMGPVAGYLVDKVGPRRMVLSGLPVMGIGFILFSQVDNLWQFYGAFVLASMGAGFGTWLPMMTVLNHWFQKRRSMAMSLAMEGFALGGVLLMPALAWAIDPDEPDRLGWRLTAAGIGVVLIILAWPVSRLIRNRPEEYGPAPKRRRAADVVHPVGRGLGRPWLLRCVRMTIVTPTDLGPVWRQHNCSRKHRTYLTMAKGIWNDAPWVSGEGAIALVACRPSGPVRYRHGAVSLHQTADSALEAKTLIDETGCGGRCHRDHRIVQLVLP